MRICWLKSQHGAAAWRRWPGRIPNSKSSRWRQLILGGMLANICVESHLRDLLEHGFEVAVARDATAAPRHPEWGDGYTAALINFRFLAHAVLTTDEVLAAITAGEVDLPARTATRSRM